LSPLNNQAKAFFKNIELLVILNLFAHLSIIFIVFASCAFTGHAEGKETLGNVQANNWQSDIDKNNVVIKPQSCKRRVEGGVIVKINIKGSNTLNEYLDYGDGSCDNLATLNINGGEPQLVSLPLRFWPLNE
jgi:hypothetical protein